MKTAIILFFLLAGRFALAGGEFQIASPAFENGKAIPAEYSRRGGNHPPPLTISDAPSGTKSLALIVDDPDAPGGVWTHFLVANLPADTAKLIRLPPGAVVGSNSWGAAGYDGPQPPAGLHHYVFRILALDAPLPLEQGFNRRELEAATKGHVLAGAQLVGTFAKEE
jgi:Raf kinase inhibitor-like YbhB/YbcL family protein